MMLESYGLGSVGFYNLICWAIGWLPDNDFERIIVFTVAVIMFPLALAGFWKLVILGRQSIDFVDHHLLKRD